MPWINDLASGLGIPASAATLAGAIYAACTAAEKAARPDALRDIGRILKDPSWAQSARPSAIIERAFVWTFADRHWSWRCVRRSGCASIFAILVVALFMSSHDQTKFVRGTVPGIPLWSPLTLLFAIILSMLPDYVCLLKSRVLFRKFGSSNPLFVILIDIILVFSIWTFSFFSFGIALIVLAKLTVGTNGQQPFDFSDALADILYGIPSVFQAAADPIHFHSLAQLSILSTLFTSVWSFLILISATILKPISSSQILVSRLFDLDSHPLQAIGIVSGVWVMTGAGIWTALRAFF